MKARVRVTLKPGILDPQGRAIQQALASLGFTSVEGVRVGKYLEVELNETDKAAAESTLKAMCEKLLANPVIENYQCDLDSH